jgi:hypothetical protein
MDSLGCEKALQIPPVALAAERGLKVIVARRPNLLRLPRRPSFRGEFGSARLWMALLLFIIALCASSWQSADGQQRTEGDSCGFLVQAVVSLDTRGPIPAVPVIINGQAANMIVDTGAESTLLSTDAIKRLGIRFDFTRRSEVHGIGPAMNSVLARIRKLELGGFALQGDALVVGGMQLPNGPRGQPDGLLGADILSGFDVDLDMPRGTMTLYRPARACPGAKLPWKDAFLTLHARRVRNKLVFPMELDGKVLAATFDTGSSAGVTIDRASAIRTGLFADNALAGDKSLQAGGATAEKVVIRLHRFSKLEIGPDIVRNPMLPVASLPGGQVDALIGAAYLKRHHIWLSYSTAEVFLSLLW